MARKNIGPARVDIPELSRAELRAVRAKQTALEDEVLAHVEKNSTDAAAFIDAIANLIYHYSRKWDYPDLFEYVKIHSGNSRKFPLN